MAPPSYNVPAIDGSTAQSAQEFSTLGFHSPGFCFRYFVVISKQMQNTMNHEFRQTILHGHAGRQAFFRCCFQGNDNIPQQFRIDFGKCPLPHGKRDDIGGSFPLKIVLVQNSDLGIIKEKNGKFAIRTAQGV